LLRSKLRCLNGFADEYAGGPDSHPPSYGNRNGRADFHSTPIVGNSALTNQIINLPSYTIVMANILLSAKSGSDWSDNELTAFNIQVDSVDAATFFNMGQLPDPLVSPVILTNESRPQGPLAKRDRLFFQYMKDAVKGEKSLVNDFAAFILGMFEYDEPERVIHQRKEV
jgi:hypothetical protein